MHVFTILKLINRVGLNIPTIMKPKPVSWGTVNGKTKKLKGNLKYRNHEDAVYLLSDGHGYMPVLTVSARNACHELKRSQGICCILYADNHYCT